MPYCPSSPNHRTIHFNLLYLARGSSTLTTIAIDRHLYQRLTSNGNQRSSSSPSIKLPVKMRSALIFTTVFAALATAAPAMTKRDDAYYGVSLFQYIRNYRSPIPIEINTLTAFTNLSAYELSFDTGAAINVDINAVECRAYKDAAGVVAGSLPFNVTTPALLATPNNPVQIGSILCYIVEIPETPPQSNITTQIRKI